VGSTTFNFSLSGTYTTSRFIWNSTNIKFWLLGGFQPVGSTTNTIQSWTYAPSNSSTNIPQQALPLLVHARVMLNEKFIKGEIDTNFIDTQFQPQDAARVKPHEDIALVAAAIKAFLRDKDKTQRMMGGDCPCEERTPWKASGRVLRTTGL